MEFKQIEKRVNRYFGKPIAWLVFGTVVAARATARLAWRTVVRLSKRLHALRMRPA